MGLAGQNGPTTAGWAIVICKENEGEETAAGETPTSISEDTARNAGLNGAGTWLAELPPKGYPPLDAWVKCQTARDGEALTIITTGMAPFIEREIELTTTTLTLAEAVARAYELCGYLIRKGPVVKDSDTVELDPGVKTRVHFRQQGRRPGVPVLQLTRGVA
jgi:hypothetical protein